MLKLIALSLAPFLIVVLAALIRSSRGLGLKAAAVGAVLAFALLATPLVSGALLHQLELSAPIKPVDAAASDAQAIVVLAAEQRPQPEFGGFGPGALSLERLRYAAHLARRTGLPVLVSGGDPAEEGQALADTLAGALEGSFGVRVKWRERQSLNTVGNARGAAAILKAQGVRRVLLVTHAWHMPRAELAFTRAGLQVIPAPTAANGDPFSRIHGPSGLVRGLIPQTSGLQASYYFIHEVIGLAVLRLTSARFDQGQ